MEMKDYIFFNTFETKSDSPNYPGATYVVTNNLKCLIDDYCLEGKTEKERNQILNCIYMFLKRTPFYQRNQIWYFVWFENKNWLTDGKTVNTWFLLNEYPKTINDKISTAYKELL